MMGMPGCRWLPVEDDHLRDMWERQGLSASQCAAQLPGKSRNAIIGRVNRLHLVKPGGNVHHADPNSVRKPRKHTLRRTTNPHKFIWETGEPPPPVPFMETESHHCRWIIGGEGIEALCCGVQKVECLSYCIQHARMAYQRAPNVSEVERARRAMRYRKLKNALLVRRAA